LTDAKKPSLRYRLLFFFWRSMIRLQANCWIEFFFNQKIKIKNGYWTEIEWICFAFFSYLLVMSVKRKSNVNFNHLLPSISLLTHTIDRSSIESDNGTNHRHSLVCLLWTNVSSQSEIDVWWWGMDSKFAHVFLKLYIKKN
jgi:hypothetical protein